MEKKDWPDILRHEDAPEALERVIDRIIADEGWTNVNDNQKRGMRHALATYLGNLFGILDGYKTDRWYDWETIAKAQERDDPKIERCLAYRFMRDHIRDQEIYVENYLRQELEM